MSKHKSHKQRCIKAGKYHAGPSTNHTDRAILKRRRAAYRRNHVIRMSTVRSSYVKFVALRRVIIPALVAKISDGPTWVNTRFAFSLALADAGAASRLEGAPSVRDERRPEEGTRDQVRAGNGARRVHQQHQQLLPGGDRQVRHRQPL